MESINSTPHRRYNLLTGEWVLVSPHRNNRPWQGKTEEITKKETPKYDPDCYLCPGNTRANGKTNPHYNEPYSFKNDFSALLPETQKIEYKKGLLKAETEKGICKVLCFSPDHSMTLPLMTEAAITQVVRSWKKEFNELGLKENINYVQIFENKGEVMGCSNPHPHCQIWSQSSIPSEIKKKSRKFKEYFERNGQSLLKDYLDQELQVKERIVEENKHFVVLVPFWAVWPFETMIVPRRHLRHIGEMNQAEEEAFAQILKKITIRYDNLFQTSFPYSSGIHQRPTNGNEYPEWHFHMSFYPPLLRSATVKKFMVGYEMFAGPQRDITAEQAAKRLRELPERHYLKT